MQNPKPPVGRFPAMMRGLAAAFTDPSPVRRHFTIPDEALALTTALELVLAALDQPHLARLGNDPVRAVLAVLACPTSTPEQWADVGAAATTEVILDRFPGLMVNASDIAWATDVAVVAHAAIVAAGLPVDQDRIAQITGDALVASQQQEVSA